MKKFKRFWWILLVIITVTAVFFAIANYIQVIQLEKEVYELKNSYKIDGSSTQDDSKSADTEKGEMPEYFSNEEPSIL